MCYCALFFCVLLVCCAAQGVFARIRLNKSQNHDMMSTRSEKIMAMVAKEHSTVNSRVEKNYTFEHVNEIVLKQNSECNNHNNDFGRNNVNNHLELAPPSNCAGSPFDIVSDDTDADPDFCLSSEEELFEHFDTRKNKQKVRRSLFNSNHDEQESIPAVKKTIEKPASIEKKPDGKEKKNFCFYCSKLVCKIGRHLENVHRNEEEIKKFTVLPKGCKERKLIIDALRKKGDFIFNTNPHYREDKNLIVCRRSKSYQNQSPSHFKVCPSCKGYFSKLSLRKHFRQCSQTWRKGERNILVNSRRIHGAIHKKANEKLKKDIFPVMREDDVTRILRYDELAILYGNKMSIKYKSRHHDSMIRSRLRLIGRFLLEIKRINLNITDFASVFQPMNYDSVIKAINNVARLDERTGKYGSPATAFALGTALKVNANTLIFECIKIGDINKKKFVKDFLKLMNEDIGSSINRTVVENQLEYNRQKKIILPTIEDIKLLNNLLATKRRECFNNLRHQFDFHEWKQLASFTLISILVFNRRRPGELERAYISDFSNCQGIEETDIDYFKKLSSKSQSTAKRYVRFKIRGKLARGVPVLLDKELEKYVRLIIDYRKQANVPDDNPYIFGLPGENSNKYLRASKLLRELSTECGAKNSFSLRATQLRKHVATQSVLLNLKQDQVHHLADFLGHDEKIHKDIYCIPIVSRDIAQMSKLLELAQGQASDGDDDSSSSEDANDQMSNFNRDISDESEKMRSFKNQNVTPCSINLNKTEGSNILHITPQKNNKSKERNTANKTDIIQRRTWTTPERCRARVLLNKYAGSGSLPSFRECEEFISKYQCLRTRTAMQLKLWVQNQIKKQNSFDLEEKTSSAPISNIRECSIVISDIMMEMEPTGKSLAGCPRNSEPAAIGRQIVNEITPKKNKNKCADLKFQLSEIKINEEASDNDSETDSEYILSSGEIHPSSSDCSTESDYEEVPVIRKTVCVFSSNTCIEPEVNSEFSQINLELSEVNSELSEDRSTYCNQSTSIKDNRGCIPSYVNSSDMKKKKHFCLFCKSLFVNLPRHLETFHFNEEEVKKFVALPKLSQERKFLINELTNKENFLFNTNPNINNGELIVNRRPAVSRKKSSDDFAPCPKCKGFMVKRTLFQHYRNCCSNTERGTKNILIKNKILNVWCHNSASESLKKNIFPPMRYDAVFSIIRYDYLLIIFGNKLCQIYKTQHFHKYIRQILRTLGRLMTSVKQIDNSVIDFALLFTPKKYDTLLEAVNQLASLNPETCSYMKPTLAFNIGTYIKKRANLLITEYIKKEEFDKKSKKEQFLTVLVEDYGVAVNKTALENQVDQRRKKKIQLPHSEDIDKLRNYLENQRIVNFAILCSKFSSAAWLSLAKCCLTYIQIFNRRRAGEMERMMINDFAQHHSLDVESMSDLDMNLSAKAKNAARDFVRFQIRGKLARTVSVLVHKNWVDALKLVLKYREEAGVPAENPYIFGIAGGSKFEYNHLEACELLRCFPLESGVKYPETIRGTLLRKHIATVVQKLSLSDSDMSLLANFMGHDDKIHKNYYRLPIVSREIGQMSNLLTVIERGEINEFKGKNLEQVCSEDTKISNTNVEDNAQMELVSEEKLPDDIFSSDSGEAAGSRNSESSAISRQFMNEITPKKNKEKCAGFNKIRRLTWSTPERHTVRSKLSKHFQNDTLPSLEECYNLIRDNEVLSNRTAPQIRLWVFNQKQRAKHESIKISGRTSWTTPQKHALRKYFRQHILEGRTPNNAECHKVLSKHQPELQGRTVPIIKSWVAAEIKRHNNN